MPDENFTELPGDRVVLRRFRLDDLPEFVAYRSCPQVARFQSWDAPYPRDEGERFIRQQMQEHPDTAGEWFQFAVALRQGGRLIGDCAAKPDAGDPRQCEIGFTIATEHQGHGYATEAARLLVGYLFTGRGNVACQEHGTTLRGFLPRAWDHPVASDGTTRRAGLGVLITSGTWCLQVDRLGGSGDGIPGGCRD